MYNAIIKFTVQAVPVYVIYVFMIDESNKYTI